MNKDQLKGGTKAVVGKVQQKVGELVGNKEQQTKGIAKKIAGKAQKAVGDAKETARDIADS